MGAYKNIAERSVYNVRDVRDVQKTYYNAAYHKLDTQLNTIKKQRLSGRKPQPVNLKDMMNDLSHALNNFDKTVKKFRNNRTSSGDVLKTVRQNNCKKNRKWSSES